MTTIQTASGEYFDFAAPSSSKFTIFDIAHALSNICRFGGHCRWHYSVAQHSVLVSHLVPREHALAGLLHDAAEAFVGDVPRPLKQMLPDYRAIEACVEHVVLMRLGVDPVLPEAVHHADKLAFRIERRALFNDDSGAPPLDRKIEARFMPRNIDQREARLQFLARYHELMGA